MIFVSDAAVQHRRAKILLEISMILVWQLEFSKHAKLQLKFAFRSSNSCNLNHFRGNMFGLSMHDFCCRCCCSEPSGEDFVRDFNDFGLAT